MGSVIKCEETTHWQARYKLDTTQDLGWSVLLHLIGLEQTNKKMDDHSESPF